MLEGEQPRSPLFFIISIVCAFALTAALLTGYWFLRQRHAERSRIQTQTQSAESPPPLPPSAQIIENDAMLKGSQAIVSGQVLNISSDTLSDLSIEFELKRRKDGTLETREVIIEPKKIEPQQQGKYSLTLPRDFSSAQIKRLMGGSGSTNLVFKTAQGLQRPPEPPPQTVKTIIVKRPATKNNGDEFINTPENPAKVP